MTKIALPASGLTGVLQMNSSAHFTNNGRCKCESIRTVPGDSYSDFRKSSVMRLTSLAWGVSPPSKPCPSFASDRG